MQVSFVRLDKELPPPRKAHSGDAAVDLRCTTDFALDPGERRAVATGLAVAIPEGFAGWVLPRSGHALESGISVVNAPGLIDSGYRGEVKVILVNLGSEPVSFERGDRIAQLSVMPVPEVDWIETDSLDDTERAGGGFGSSGQG